MEGKMHEMSYKEEIHEIDFEMKTKLNSSVDACSCSCVGYPFSQTSEAVKATNENYT
jgi:hypothetical protein